MQALAYPLSTILSGRAIPGNITTIQVSYQSINNNGPLDLSNCGTLTNQGEYGVYSDFS